MSRDVHIPTPQQNELVSWVASLGAVTAEALADRRGGSIPSARAMLVAAQRCNLLTRERPLAGRPALYSLTRAGLRACDARGTQVCRVSPANANHLIACASAAVALERCYPSQRVVGERELRRDERELGSALASAQVGSLGAPGSNLHRPDLVLWPRVSPGGLPVAVEIELTIKAPRRLVAICRAWARCRAVAGVLYLAPPVVGRALLRAVAEARAGERIVVVPLTALPGMVAEAGRSGSAAVMANGRKSS
jgi:hypothetical protein